MRWALKEAREDCVKEHPERFKMNVSCKNCEFKDIEFLTGCLFCKVDNRLIILKKRTARNCKYFQPIKDPRRLF